MSRLAEYTVSCGLVIAWRLAMLPTSRLPFLAIATTDGVSAWPVRFLMTMGWPSWTVATMLFGYAHRYQGWRGMAATTIVGSVLTMIYLVSGRLWVAMLVHAAIDLNGLVLRPMLAGRWLASPSLRA